jgi:hypothetical protein
MSRVREISLPPTARAHSTLAHVDYEDAFLLDTGPDQGRTAEQWARAMLEGAPASFRRSAPRAWHALGLRHGSTSSDEFVLGWPVRRSTPDVALLGARSRVGMPAELLFERRGDTLLFATLVQHDNPVARAVWAVIGRPHRRIVHDLLERVGRSAT